MAVQEIQNKAWNVGDLARATTFSYRKKLELTRALILEYVDKHNIGVSFSGGKDSTVLINLMREAKPEIPCAFYDSGIEYEETYDLIKHYKVKTIQPIYNMPFMLRASGEFGSEPTQEGIEYDFTFFLVFEPALRFAEMYDLDAIALGLRGKESKGRLANFNTRGYYYEVADEPARFNPLSNWTTDDIWAYIASNGIKYNKIYDLMTQHGIDRESQRVSTLLGGKGGSFGRMARLKTIKPSLFNKLAKEYPEITRQL